MIGSAFGWALVNWAADVACLSAAIAAIGVPVPWDKLLLIWSAGAVAASFSPTPYGLGVVDIALITALHAAGIASPEAIGAVLLYRIITFKVLVTLLWIGYRYLQDRSYRGVTRVASPSVKDFRSCRAGDVITLPGPWDELLVKTVRLRQGGIIPTVSPAVDDARPQNSLSP